MINVNFERLEELKKQIISLKGWDKFQDIQMDDVQTDSSKNLDFFDCLAALDFVKKSLPSNLMAILAIDLEVRLSKNPIIVNDIKFESPPSIYIFPNNNAGLLQSLNLSQILDIKDAQGIEILQRQDDDILYVI